MRYPLLILVLLVIIGAPIWAIFGSKLFEKGTSDKPNDLILEFNVEFPEDELVTDANAILLTGSAPQESFLAIVGPQISEILKVDGDGKFSQDLKLENGFNQFKIVSFDKSGIKHETFRQIYLLKGWSSLLTLNANDLESTNSSDLEKFKDKLKESRSTRNLRVVAGTVKSALGDSLTVSKFQNVKTIKINDQTKVTDYDTGNSFDFEKILANDFVVSVGNLDATGVYASQSLLVSKNKAIEFPNKFIFSNVSSIIGETVNVSDENLSKYQVNLSGAKNLTGEKIEVGDKIAIAGKLEEDQLTATNFVLFKTEKKQNEPSEDLQTATDSAD